jgi:hypothetical protein
MGRIVVAVLAIGLAAAITLELGLRAAGFNALQWYRADRHLGWTLRPNLSGWFSEEGRSFVRLNSAGLRDREHAVQKADDVYRIVVLGDAYSEAMQVTLADTYWAQLPGRLESCGFRPNKRIEVLNFGVRDYGTAQSYLQLERTALRYEPDLVLLQFSHGNDVRDNSHALDEVRGRPYFKLDGQGRLQLDASFTSTEPFARRASYRRELLTRMLDHSRALQLARRVAISAVRTAHASTTGNEAGLEIHTLAAPRDKLWEAAWGVTEALIAKIGESASRNGAKVAVVVAPFAMEVHPDAAWRERLQVKYGVPDLAYPDRRIVSFARENGMLGIMLAPEMQARAAATGSHLYGYENAQIGIGHWNELGHRAAADIIARSLCANRSW